MRSLCRFESYGGVFKIQRQRDQLAALLAAPAVAALIFDHSVSAAAMFFSSIRQWFSSKPKTIRRRPSRFAHAFNLCLERLEDRITPSAPVPANTSTITYTEGDTPTAIVSVAAFRFEAPTPTGPIGTVLPSPGYDSPTFSWSAVASADHYQLRVIDKTLNMDVINEANISGTSFTPGPSQALTPGHTYQWRVAAVSVSGSTKWSA